MPVGDALARLARFWEVLMAANIFMVLLVLAAAYFTYRLAGGLRLYLKLRGKRLVACPETDQVAAGIALTAASHSGN